MLVAATLQAKSPAAFSYPGKERLVKHLRHGIGTRLITNVLFPLILLDAGLAYANAPVINEFVLNHTGTDFNEYVEILGDPNTDFFNVWVLSLEGDSESNRGAIDAAVRFGTSDANGLVTTLYQTNGFENQQFSF
jgi:hypothetical protein